MLERILKFIWGGIRLLPSKGTIILPWVTIISIPVGGWWAYHNFSITDTDAWNPEVSVAAEVLPYNEKELIVVHVRPKNIGKVPIRLLGESKGDISVSLGELPTNHAIGRINDSEITDITEIKSLVSENSGEYDLEPGVEYDDVQYFVAPKPKVTKYYVATVELDFPYTGKADEGYAVYASTVIKVEP